MWSHGPQMAARLSVQELCLDVEKMGHLTTASAQSLGGVPGLKTQLPESLQASAGRD